MMKFAIIRDFFDPTTEKYKRKFVVEWNQDKILLTLRAEIIKDKRISNPIETADMVQEKFLNVIEKFKEETIKIP